MWFELPDETSSPAPSQVITPLFFVLFFIFSLQSGIFASSWVLMLVVVRVKKCNWWFLNFARFSTRLVLVDREGRALSHEENFEGIVLSLNFGMNSVVWQTLCISHWVLTKWKYRLKEIHCFQTLPFSSETLTDLCEGPVLSLSTVGGGKLRCRRSSWIKFTCFTPKPTLWAFSNRSSTFQLIFRIKLS